MLLKKMLRDIRKNLSQFITIFLMIMIGIMVYTGINAYMDGMTDTSNSFYKNNNLQDFNVVGNLSKQDLNNIKKIKHINHAERKLVVTSQTDKGNVLNTTFIESNEISKFHVYEGEKFDVHKSGVWLDDSYAKFNKIKIGDILTIRYDDLNLKEKVLGLIHVPDHLYDTRDESELFPDRTTFGFAYLSVNEISEDYVKSFVMKEMNISDDHIFHTIVKDFDYKEHIPFNYIMVDVDQKSNRDYVKETIEEKIQNASAVIKVEDIPSYTAYKGEIDEGKTYIGVFSGLFLFIAMLSVITTMTRVVKKQRIQIGTLKALGFTDRKILCHYISYGLWISIVAAIIGLILGYYFIGTIFYNMEMEIFALPAKTPIIENKNYIMALVVIGIILFVSYLACRSILKESPADTLKVERPKINSKFLKLTTNTVFQKLNFSNKWNIRDIFRNKMRTIMGIAGVTGCAMLIVCAFGMLDSMNYFVKLQFSDLYHFQYKLVLKDHITEDTLNHLYNQYGTHTSKTYLIEIKKDGKKESNNIFVTNAKDFVRFVDKKGNFTKINKDNGVYVTEKLAKNNGYKLGDNVTWHIYGEDQYYKSKIVGFHKDPQNQNITMTKKYLESLNIQYIPDTIYTNQNFNQNEKITGVDVIQDKEVLKEGMNDMLGRMKTMLMMIIAVAILLGIVIIYNLGILSYTEKEYQFATLKVLGFNDKQIKKIFVKQNNWIAILSIILGLPLGYYLTDWLFKTAIEEHYDFAAHITIYTYIIAAIGTFLVSHIVSLLLSKKIKSIDMVSSLKGNE